ncbi:MAG: transcriptional regulator NrdR [Pyrinomonadaceae bacterium]|nr:transcriptional regulator NrdR [Pyrinomonadaceae bacterium]MCX7639045.1 transcriptional regulator NrdR [Pyrinomonadaceae bacterium]MDW8303734.1 transcriptional regulator NrdR [Acidobacteriota bacterium]
MKCPFCGCKENKVVDSRDTDEEKAIRRRRECLSCKQRFTTYEKIERSYFVIKKDGRREPFDREKVANGLYLACKKRPVSNAQIEAIVDEIERRVQEAQHREFPTFEIGKIIIERLKSLDKVAYVRFASVYLGFEDLSDFIRIIEESIQDYGRSYAKE